MNYERRNEIIALINQKGTIKNQELMDLYNISIETVRRDLEFLEQRGHLKRVYGGAIRKEPLSVEPAYNCRSKERAAEKTAIALEAIRLIQPGEPIYLDLGTTPATMAENLRNTGPITVFTNSIHSAIALSLHPDCSVIMLGGQLRAGELGLSGFPAEENLEHFNIGKAFISVGGITEDGITDYHVGEASLRRRIIRKAGQVVVMADHSKFGYRAMNNICSLEEIDVVITDSKTPKKILRQIEQAGVRVIVAKE